MAYLAATQITELSLSSSQGAISPTILPVLASKCEVQDNTLATAHSRTTGGAHGRRAQHVACRDPRLSQSGCGGCASAAADSAREDLGETAPHRGVDLQDNAARAQENGRQCCPSPTASAWTHRLLVHRCRVRLDAWYRNCKALERGEPIPKFDPARFLNFTLEPHADFSRLTPFGRRFQKRHRHRSWPLQG